MTFKHRVRWHGTHTKKANALQLDDLRRLLFQTLVPFHRGKHSERPASDIQRGQFEQMADFVR